MTPYLLSLLADPLTGEPLRLEAATHDAGGDIVTGTLASSRRGWPILDGIPRFTDGGTEAVHGFGEQWNYFNFTQAKDHWVEHTVRNTFGSTAAFRDRLVVDAGAGAGAQALWMLQAGARHVVLLELSQSVDDVVQRNLRDSGFRNYDVVQCSIDAPPLRDQAIDGMIVCHNVIQHTPDVERTARALYRKLWRGELVVNCYEKNVTGLPRRLRWELFTALRRVLPRLPFAARLAYARAMGVLSLWPPVAELLRLGCLAVTGQVPRGNATLAEYLRRRFRATVLNTFDLYGAHHFQHYLTNVEMEALVLRLQPDRARVLNLDRYFGGRRPPGCALRVLK